jgi:ketosteroid isomerase-like protein
MISAVALAEEQARLSATLDGFHQAAARADFAGYTGFMTEDVIFLGTDGSERWQGQAFRDFVRSNFSSGRGWTYLPLERNLMLSADGQTAWFDEVLQNEELGTCRGSGVLVKSGNGWKIAQYNLSVPVPNAIVYDVAADIASLNITNTREVDESIGTAATAPAGSTATASEATAPDPTSEQPEVKETISQQEAEPKPEACRNKRFKTNTKAGC